MLAPLTEEEFDAVKDKIEGAYLMRVPGERTYRGLTDYIADHPIAGWEGFVNAVAFPYAPYEIERGAVWRFSLNHVWELDDPLAPFPIELVEL